MFGLVVRLGVAMLAWSAVKSALTNPQVVMIAVEPVPVRRRRRPSRPGAKKAGKKRGSARPAK